MGVAASSALATSPAPAPPAPAPPAPASASAGECRPASPSRRTSGWSGAGRIDGVEDVARVLSAVNDRAGRRANLAGVIAPAIMRADEAVPAVAGLLPVAPEIAEVLPWHGLRRGATVAVIGSSSLLLALLAGAMRGGGWAAVVGLPALSPVAADEYGIDLARLALIPDPGPEWTATVASLVDGLDTVVVHTPGPVADRTARTLMSRARQRGAVLLTTRGWPGADLSLHATGDEWTGLGHGRGRLRGHTVAITARGRGSAARPRTARVPLPPPSLSTVTVAHPDQPRSRPTNMDSPRSASECLVG